MELRLDTCDLCTVIKVVQSANFLPFIGALAEQYVRPRRGNALSMANSRLAQKVFTCENADHDSSSCWDEPTFRECIRTVRYLIAEDVHRSVWTRA